MNQDKIKVDFKTATEAELRDCEALWPKTEEELLNHIRELLVRTHDYGTCCYAMSLASVATFHYIAHKLGVTGFQAGCADMDFIGRTRRMKRFAIQDYGNLMYPQYKDHFKNFEQLIQENKEWLKEEALNKLAENDGSAVEVKKHWEYLANL